MKTKDIRVMDAAARQKELEGLLKEQFNLRMQKGTAQLASPAQMKKVRRDIARIRTVMNEPVKGESA
ncbi:MAG: 50S ribosomal protein L29 [Gammaproteobacteria bacterium]|nr:MAG: 50S ribosomal protein L29 [Gammaproteobacteria bacterium]